MTGEGLWVLIAVGVDTKRLEQKRAGRTIQCHPHTDKPARGVSEVGRGAGLLSQAEPGNQREAGFLIARSDWQNSVTAARCNQCQSRFPNFIVVFLIEECRSPSPSE